MGNQLVSYAPTQISPTEEYLRQAQFETDLVFEVNMASTRFFKVARVRTDEGNAVVKVFLKHDVTIDTVEHVKRLEHLKKYLTNAVNCLPYQRSLDTEKAAFLLREYVRHSLYDKVSTRPFMTTLEKRWITFQILCALHQCHKHRICHGDIKLENILITSWNWVLLSDFASYKPTYLPVNNPADFTYFFDTSRRRACYLAPERFLEPVNTVKHDEDAEKADNKNAETDAPEYSRADAEASVRQPTPQAADKPRFTFPKSIESKSMIGSCIQPAGENVTDQLLPEMDIFSAGCALLELWSDGKAPFDLSQLLNYRQRNVEHVHKVLATVRNVHLRELIASMISIEAADRRSADVYLDQERGRLFPDYFYTFLQSYMQMFSSIPIMSPDDKIKRLYSDMGHIISMLCDRPCDWVQEEEENQKQEGETIKANVEVKRENAELVNRALHPKEASPKSTNEGLIIMTTLVTSCTRGVKHCMTKIRCLEILQQLAEHSDSETILDRILPYILHFTADPMARVRVCAIDTLTDCLHLITEVTRRDADVFPEYVLPSIAVLATDSAVVVRIAYARNIARLAETAVRYLEQTTQAFVDEDTPPLRYETELGALQEMVQQTVSCLLTDQMAIVKQTLVETDVDKLCRFLGPQKANDLILSHMITFLNDKDDHNLRGSFFDNIVQVASFVGWQSSGCLVPLLLQGLTDPDEFLVAKAINATARLCDKGLIQKAGMCEFIVECAPYLIHPNLWVRHETCGLLVAAANLFSAIDIQCKVMPAIQPHMKCPVLQLERPDVVMNHLNKELSRNSFDCVVRFPDIKLLMKTLEQRVFRRRLEAQGHNVLPEPMSTSMINFFRRLTPDALPELEEMQLLALRPYLMKLNKCRAQEHHIPNEGRIILQRTPDVFHEYELSDRPAGAGPNGRYVTGKNRLNSENEPGSGGTFEWQHMFEQLTGVGGKVPLPVGGDATAVGVTSSLLGAAVEYSMAERTVIQERHSECWAALDTLRTQLKQNYRNVTGTRTFREIQDSRDLSQGWRPKGTLVAHLHEHRAAVSKLTTLGSEPCGSATSNLFASCSLDGTVRVWDVNRLDGNHSINRSTQVYNANAPLYAMAAADGGRSLAVAGRDGSLMLLRIDSNSSKMALQEAKNLNEAPPVGGGDDGSSLPLGPVVDMQPLLHGSHSLIVYATLYGTIVCWDLRMPEAAWRVRTALRNGVVTTICADPTSSWLATGTSGGKHVCWDLRFRLPIAEIKHPFDYRIRKIVAHPTEHSKLISATAGNNEMSIWDIETQHRQGVLWASGVPPLSNQVYERQNTTSSTVCGLFAGTSNHTPFILSAGSDQRIRYWDLNAINWLTGGGSDVKTPTIKVDERCAETRVSANCAVVVPAAREPLPDLYYESRLIDGTAVIYEVNNNCNASPAAGGATGSNATAQASNVTGSGSSAMSGGTSRPAGGSNTGTGVGNSGGLAEEQQPRSGPDQPPPGHNDVITDLLMCRSQKQQYFMASSSRDGVVKVWK